MIKCGACLDFYHFFATNLITFDVTEAQMLGLIYHVTINFTLKSCFLRETLRFRHIYDVITASIYNVTKICKPLVVYRF